LGGSSQIYFGLNEIVKYDKDSLYITNPEYVKPLNLHHLKNIFAIPSWIRIFVQYLKVVPEKITWCLVLVLIKIKYKMAKLTSFSKLLLTVLIVAGIVLGGKYFLDNTEAGKKLLKKSAESSTSTDNNDSTADTDPNTVKVGVVTWGGYAGGQYFNEGFKANTESRFYKDYGMKVDFKVLDDFEASRAAFKNGDVDLLWCTVDALPTEMASLEAFDPRVVFQADWSRGGDAVVVRRGITSVSDLKGKKVAVAELTPSHSFLLWLLDAAGMKISDIQIVKQPSAIDAAQVFKSQQVDAAVVWSPDDELCIQSVPGSKILESTRSASNIIADAFIAKGEWLDKNRDKANNLYEGWMKGAAEINNSDANKRKAAKILSENFEGVSEDAAYKSINNVRLCTHGDNLNFFGMNPEYKGVTGENLYNKMTNTYQQLGYIEGKVPSWRLAINTEAIKAATALANMPGQTAEGQKQFTVATEETKNREAIATKRVSISFRSGEFLLDENTKYIIDKEFVDIARAFSNARIRIEGNTDNIGNAASNKALSLKRAKSVAEYLITTYKMPRNRFIIIGNGPDKPVAGNDTEAGRSKNRRTDFEIVGE
jgi:NitT/TauT family transport system substrate-binding protein